MSTEAILAYFFIVFLLYALARLFAGPFRTAIVFLLYFCLGTALLFLANLASRPFGATVALNPFNALVAGFLNIPGVILLFLLRYWFRL